MSELTSDTKLQIVRPEFICRIVKFKYVKVLNSQGNITQLNMITDIFHIKYLHIFSQYLDLRDCSFVGNYY